MKWNYRADIDGLRAVAVLSVLAYHAVSRYFPGGYIGVDVFFVISGYLITGIIMREIEKNEFSLARFYERRIRRIYPALFAMLFFTIVATSILYDAYVFKDFSESVLATTFFFSNIYFWMQTGYFEGDALLKPLLHTWSLAVEEQYYIVFPLLMAILARYFKPKILQILIGIAAISFLGSIYVVGNNPSDAFYLPHLRAWELLVGSILALNPVSSISNSILRNMLSMTGLGMIVIPVFMYSPETPFPGVAAAIPVLGTAFIIYSGIGEAILVNKLLSMPPLVFIGKISYSLYLWHWPLIQFATYYSIKKITRIELVALLFATLAVSVLSWKLIEQPFRASIPQKRPHVFLSAAGVMGITAAMGLFIFFMDGLPIRFAKHQVYEDKEIYTECDFRYNNNNLQFCPIGDVSKKPSFLLWGDSHAASIGPGVDVSASGKSVSGLLAFNPVCAPLLGITANRKSNCVEFNDVTLEYIESHPELTTVILAGRWAYMAEGVGYKESGKIKLVDTLSESSKSGITAILFERGLTRTVEQLLALGRRVVIVSQVPEVRHDVPSSLSIAQRTARDVNEIIAPTLEQYLSRNEKVFWVINSVQADYDVQVIDPWKALCDEQRCLVAVEDTPIYVDAHHLSTFGSEYISYLYDPIFETLAGEK